MSIAKLPEQMEQADDKTASQSKSNRMKQWLKRLGVAMVLVVLAASIAIAIGLQRMRVADEQHAAFLDCGKTINNFLMTYAAALDTAFELNDPAVILAMYSDRYLSPNRGRWSFDGG
jgi:hypothetical protein